MATKWTSVIVSRFLGLNTALAITSCPAASVRVAAHSRSYASADKPLSPEELERKKQEANMRRLEKQRLRYQSDPERRERMKQASKKRYERYTTDSEFREKLLRRNKERFANNLAFRERETQRSHETWLAKMSRLEQDPEAHKLYKSEHNESVKAFYHQSAEYRWSQSVRQRCNISARFRDEVVWKRHEIVSYPTKTNHRCATCNNTKFKGLKLWYVVLDTASNTVEPCMHSSSTQNLQVAPQE